VKTSISLKVERIPVLGPDLEGQVEHELHKSVTEPDDGLLVTFDSLEVI
jgi:hypothetical protein